jgi:hypothetical protein
MLIMTINQTFCNVQHVIFHDDMVYWLWPYFFTIFAPFPKMMKVATNGQKVKAPALLFCNFLPLSKMKK